MSSPGLVIIEMISVSDSGGLAENAKRASALMGDHGGELLGQGGTSVEGEGNFETLVVQRWRSEKAFLAWQDSDDYRPLKAIRRASANLRVAIVPLQTSAQQDD